MIDFSKLLNETHEEKEQREAANERRQAEQAADLQNKEVAARANKSTQRVAITVDEFSFRMTRDLDTQIQIYGKDGAGERITVVIPSLPDENSDVLANLSENIEIGAKMVLDGKYESRNWKDSNNQWRSAKEFFGYMPVIPATLSVDARLPQNIERRPSYFSLQQNNLGAIQNRSR